MVLFNRRDCISPSRVGDKFLLAIGTHADLGDREASADLEKARLAQEIPRRRHLEEVDIQVGGHGGRHPADRRQDGDVYSEIGEAIMVGPESVPPGRSDRG